VTLSFRLRRGRHFLNRVLQANPVDCRTAAPGTFRRWLLRRVRHWRRDPVFAQRANLRELRRQHPQLAELERQHRDAARSFQTSPTYPPFLHLERDLHRAARAITGISDALAEGAPGKEQALVQKLGVFQARQAALTEQLRQLEQDCAAYRVWRHTAEALRQFRGDIGLDQAEAVLQDLLQQQGRRSGRRGQSFEVTAAEVTRQILFPELLRREGSTADAARLRLLTGVTLGAARLELDQLVIRTPEEPGTAAEVLALVEVKRNANDLAHGFRQRQENLAWLTGDRSAYDPTQYRTGIYRNGHFDRPARHRADSEEFVLASDSFHRFRRDRHTRYFLNRLYLITRPGPVWNISSRALARFRDWVARDLDWDPHSAAYVQHLHRRLQALLEPLGARDLLALYAAHPRYGRNVLFVKEE
jgi:hypothetical protein